MILNMLNPDMDQADQAVLDFEGFDGFGRGADDRADAEGAGAALPEAEAEMPAAASITSHTAIRSDGRVDLFT